MEKLVTEPGVSLQCGWGRLLIADTFPDADSVAKAILKENESQRDIAMYLIDPHIVLNCAPQNIFLDPSNTYRLKFEDYPASSQRSMGFELRPLKHKEELDDINRIYRTHRMVPLKSDYVWENRRAEEFTYFVACSLEDDSILGVAMGADHSTLREDMPNRCSLWALAVDPQAEFPGIGEALVRYIIEYYQDRGRQEMDISVLHDNEMAVRLYEKLNFKRVSAFAAKHKNSINEKLFVGTPAPDGYNPYATIIINEALRRSISVDPISPERGHFRLSLGARSVLCWESLSAMTSALAVIRSSDKQLTRELLTGANLSAPDQIVASDVHHNLQFLNQHKSVVVKPLEGEQGKGISVDVRSQEGLEKAIAMAKQFDDTVLLEQFVEGADLRIIVINNEVVAAAVRKPPVIVGTGKHTAKELIERLSRRRQAATGGESSIPLDDETERCLKLSGYSFDDVIDSEVAVSVRKTANLHTGGTIHDVTAELHPELAEAAIRAAQILEIPVVGLDFMVKAVDQPQYAIIEANERPGLANHEPQPTAQKFIDFLFPQSIVPTQSDSAQ